MPRDVDEKKTRKALRKLQRLVERAEAEGIELTDWEQGFVEGPGERLNKYGSAFADPSKGSLDEAISNAQNEIMRQLDKKSRGKTSGGFTTRKPLQTRKPLGGRKIPAPEESVTEDAVTDDNLSDRVVLFKSCLPSGPSVVKPSEPMSEKQSGTDRSVKKPPVFRVIEGGRNT